MVGDIATTYGTHFKDMFKDNDNLNFLVTTLMNEKDEEANAISEFVISEVKKVIGH